MFTTGWCGTRGGTSRGAEELADTPEVCWYSKGQAEIPHTKYETAQYEELRTTTPCVVSVTAPKYLKCFRLLFAKIH